MKARIVTSSVGGAGAGAGAGMGIVTRGSIGGAGVGDGSRPGILSSAWNVWLLSKTAFCRPVSATWGRIDITRMLDAGFPTIAAVARGCSTLAGCTAARSAPGTVRAGAAVSRARFSCRSFIFGSSMSSLLGFSGLSAGVPACCRHPCRIVTFRAKTSAAM